MKHVCLMALVIVSLPIGAPASAAEVKPVAVPIEILKTKHLAVQIKVNGKGPYRVIFDTGAPITLLNNKIAKDAELVGKDKGLFPPLFGMRGEVKIKSLEIGDLKTEDVTVVVMDHPALAAVSRALGPVDGIVGFPFFSRFRMTLDYQAQQMTFVPVDYQAESVMDNLMLMMMEKKPKAAKKILAPTTVWGFQVDKAKGDEEAGVEVTQVLPGSPADAGGLRIGDRLLILDGTWTDSVVDCHRAAAGVQPGQTVKARLRRDKKEIESSITPKAGL